VSRGASNYLTSADANWRNDCFRKSEDLRGSTAIPIADLSRRRIHFNCPRALEIDQRTQCVFRAPLRDGRNGCSRSKSEKRNGKARWREQRRRRFDEPSDDRDYREPAPQQLSKRPSMFRVEIGGEHRSGTPSIRIVGTARLQFDHVPHSAAHDPTIPSNP
jgi:hypothetical protein